MNFGNKGSQPQIDIGGPGLVSLPGESSFFDDDDVIVPNIDVMDSREVPYVDLGSEIPSSVPGIQVISEKSKFDKIGNKKQKNFNGPTIEFSRTRVDSRDSRDSRNSNNHVQSDDTIEVPSDGFIKSRKRDRKKKKERHRRRDSNSDNSDFDYNSYKTERKPDKIKMPSYDPDPNNIPEKERQQERQQERQGPKKTENFGLTNAKDSRDLLREKNFPKNDFGKKNEPSFGKTNEPSFGKTNEPSFGKTNESKYEPPKFDAPRFDPPKDHGSDRESYYSSNEPHRSSKPTPSDLDFSFLHNKEKVKKVVEPIEFDSDKEDNKSDYYTEASDIRPPTYEPKPSGNFEPRITTSYNNEEDSYKQKQEYKSPDYNYQQEPKPNYYDPQPPQQNYGNENNYGNNGNNGYGNYPEPYDDNEPVFKNESEEKMHYLIQLQGLEKKGVQLSGNYNMKSPLSEIKMEYKYQSGAIERDSSVKWMKKALVMCVSGMCLLNKKYDPINAKLEGWDESVMENVDDYNGIFERLHKKYQGTAEMAPEMELLLALAGSAFTFHLTNSLFKTAIPNLASTIQSNPNLMSGLFGAVNEAAQKTSNQQAQQAYNPGVQMPNPFVGGQQQYQSQQPQQQYQQHQQPQMHQPMNSPSFDISSLLSSMGLGMGSGNQGHGPGSAGTPLPQAQTSGLGSLGAGLETFNGAIGNPPPGPIDSRERNDPPLGDTYRRMIEKDQRRNVQKAVSSTFQNNDAYSEVSGLSDSSEIRTVSIGQRKTKKGTKKGGLVLNL